ncbi:MAG: hypothetical protein QG604_618 [Candidatus Dependentiae bacterium]|nr:hypothetical protein [Candidatus Dependentiae bacterium]
MMIAFNLTLLVQIMNFLIVYYVLRRVVFDPVIDALVKQKIDERRLNEEIALKQVDVNSFQAEKASQLVQFQQDVKVQLASDTIKIVLDPQYTSRAVLRPVTSAELLAFKKKLEESLHAGS